jgi:hypothetical protein
MSEFTTFREALDHMAARIAARAQEEGTPLSEVERKMLYFSETDPQLPDQTAFNREFGLSCDEDEYERKIAAFAHSIEEHDNFHPAARMSWNRAFAKLGEGDFYLFAILNNPDLAPDQPPHLDGFLPTFDPPNERPPHDRLKLWLAAIAIVFVLSAIAILWTQFSPHLPPRILAIADWLLQDREHSRAVFDVVVLIALATWWFRRFGR